MAETSLAPLSFDSQEHDVSAPSSADFFYQRYDGSTKQLFLERPLVHVREPFPRINGEPGHLVDVDVYLDYIVDHPGEVPLEIGGSNNPFVYQHKYWKEWFYKQKGTDQRIIDANLVAFQASPYNQLGMRKYQELRVHQRFEEFVSPPHPVNVERSVVDFKVLDNLGAAVVGRRVALVPEALEYIAPGNGLSKQTELYSPREITEFFEGQIELALEKLEAPLITPRRVVTGVISRIARLTNSDVLGEEAAKRISEDDVFYPMRIRSISGYYQMSADMLAKIDEPSSNVISLQTGVDRVQLAA